MFSKIKKNLSFINQKVSLPLLLIIFAIAIVSFFSSKEPFQVEFRQTVIFPFIFFLFYFLPREKNRRLPMVLAITALFSGVFFSLESRGYLPMLTTTRGAILLDLTDKSGENVTRDRFRSYNQLAKRYDFPTLHLVHQEVGPALTKQQLFSRQSSAVAILAGDVLWPEVVFRSDVSYYEAPSEFKKLSEEELTVLKELELDPVTDLSIVSSGEGGVYLALQVVPEKFKLPSAKIEISDRLLGWLLKGLAIPFSGEEQEVEQSYTKQQDSFLSASRVLGQWPSGGAKAASGLLLADSYFREALASEMRQEAVSRCSLDEYGLAAGFTSSRAEPQTYASIFNNAAVALVFSATDEKDLLKARSWLSRAAAVVDSQGAPVRAARLAVFNMVQLDRAGLSL